MSPVLVKGAGDVAAPWHQAKAYLAKRRKSSSAYGGVISKNDRSGDEIMKNRRGSMAGSVKRKYQSGLSVTQSAAYHSAYQHENVARRLFAVWPAAAITRLRVCSWRENESINARV